MNDYSAISDVSNSIAGLLRSLLVPELVGDGEGILLCSPADRGDAVVSIYMYDMKDEGTGQMGRSIPFGEGRIMNPSVYLKLSYMISVFSKADPAGRNIEEMKILGFIIQALNDNFFISTDTYEFTEDGRDNPIRIEPARLSEEEKYKILSLPNMINKPSLFYTVAPVEIKSGKGKKISRVKEFGIASRTADGK